VYFFLVWFFIYTIQQNFQTIKKKSMTKKNKTLLSLLGVAAVGAGVAYLMTTEKGGRIRKNLKDKTQGLVNGLKRNKNQVASSDSRNSKVGSSHVPAY
jgi:hypothetical protein